MNNHILLAWSIAATSLMLGTSYDITFERMLGTFYNPQFNPDISTGNWANVGTHGTISTSHDPGVDAEGFYRSAKVAPVVPAP